MSGCILVRKHRVTHSFEEFPVPFSRLRGLYLRFVHETP